MFEIKIVEIENPSSFNVILGQSHFIKTVEDLHESLYQASMGIKFGLSFCEASGPRLIRSSGNRDDLIELSKRNAMKISCGHSFVIFMDQAFPIHVLKQIQMVPEVCTIFCASANPLQVAVIETSLGRGVIGVIDGQKPEGFEKQIDVLERHKMLRSFGYKL
jgi:adenosine/AMP kinase